MVRVAEFNRGDPSSSPGRAVYTSTCKLYTQSMSSSSSKSGRGVSARFHLAVFVYGVNQEKKEAKGVQHSQHRWRITSPQTFLQLWKIIEQSHIQNSVKHKRRSLTAKVRGVPWDDWANDGCVNGLLQVWWVGFSYLGSCPIVRNRYGISR